MALADLMKMSHNREVTERRGLTEARIKVQIPILRQYVAFWREYPDIFVEFLCGSNPEHFHLYFYLTTLLYLSEKLLLLLKISLRRSEAIVLRNLSRISKTLLIQIELPLMVVRLVKLKNFSLQKLRIERTRNFSLLNQYLNLARLITLLMKVLVQHLESNSLLRKNSNMLVMQLFHY